MNGYEKHSKDYGGPPPGWGTKLMIIGVATIIVVALTTELFFGLG